MPVPQPILDLIANFYAELGRDIGLTKEEIQLVEGKI